MPYIAPRPPRSRSVNCSTDSTNLPDGQITSCFPKWLVQPLLQKYFASRLSQISSLIRAVPSHMRGVAHVTDAGWNAVDADSSHLTNGADADGQVVWF